jgi:hypothetical protein
MKNEDDDTRQGHNLKQDIKNKIINVWYIIKNFKQYRSCSQEVIGEDVVQEPLAWFVKQAAPDFLLIPLKINL